MTADRGDNRWVDEAVAAGAQDAEDTAVQQAPGHLLFDKVRSQLSLLAFSSSTDPAPSAVSVMAQATVHVPGRHSSRDHHSEDHRPRRPDHLPPVAAMTYAPCLSPASAPHTG